MALEVWLYRHDNGDGSAKDWAYPVDTSHDAAELTVFYGRTGATLRQAVTPAAACRGRNPRDEALERADRKCAKGYRSLGKYRLADNRRDLSPVDPNGPSAPTDSGSAPVCLYWRRCPDRFDDRAIRRVLWDAVPPLCEAGWLSQDDPLVDSPNGLWLEISDAQEQGCVPLDEANVLAIACFVLLARAEVGVSLANEAGERITAWPDEIPVATGILETLGLKPHNLNRLLAAAGDDDWFF